MQQSLDFWCKLSSPFVVAESQKRCFELFRMENSQIFSELHPWTAQRLFSLLHSLKASTLQKLLDMAMPQLILGYSRKPNRRLRMYLFEKRSGIFIFTSLLLEIPKKTVFHSRNSTSPTPLGNSKVKNQDPWKFHMIFFITPRNPNSFLNHPWNFQNLMPLEIPSPQPLLSLFFLEQPIIYD